MKNGRSKIIEGVRNKDKNHCIKLKFVQIDSMTTQVFLTLYIMHRKITVHVLQFIWKFCLPPFIFHQKKLF